MYDKKQDLIGAAPTLSKGASWLHELKPMNTKDDCSNAQHGKNVGMASDQLSCTFCSTIGLMIANSSELLCKFDVARSKADSSPSHFIGTSMHFSSGINIFYFQLHLGTTSICCQGTMNMLFHNLLSNT